MSDNIIELKGVNKWFGDFQVLKNVDLNVASKQKIVVCGPSGSGKSLGMGYWRLHLLVILPQALKLVIPGIANTFLALVKDTPLILVVGLLEFLGMINLAKTNPEWLGFAAEGYVFAAAVYWVFCYAMSRYSQNLEVRFSTERK